MLKDYARPIHNFLEPTIHYHYYHYYYYNYYYYCIGSTVKVIFLGDNLITDPISVVLVMVCT